LCRAAIEGGAKMVDEEPPPPPMQHDSLVALKGYVLVLWENKNKNVSQIKTDDEIVGRRRTKAVLGDEFTDTSKTHRKIDDVDNPDFIFKVPAQPSTPLPQIHSSLLRNAVVLNSWNLNVSAFSYVCNGVPIPRAHYQVFEARHFVPALYVRSNKVHRQSLADRKRELKIEYERQLLSQKKEKKNESKILTTQKKEDIPVSKWTTPLRLLAVHERKGYDANGVPPGWSEKRKSTSRNNNTLRNSVSFISRNKDVDMSKVDAFSQNAAKKFGLYLDQNRSFEIVEIMGIDADLPPPPSSAPPLPTSRPPRIKKAFAKTTTGEKEK